jgi:hypothetical protein
MCVTKAVKQKCVWKFRVRDRKYKNAALRGSYQKQKFLNLLGIVAYV